MYSTTPLLCIYIYIFFCSICPKLPFPIHHGAVDRVWTNKLQDSLGGTSCSKHPRVFGSGDFWCLHLSIHDAERVSLWHGHAKRPSSTLFAPLVQSPFVVMQAGNQYHLSSLKSCCCSSEQCWKDTGFQLQDCGLSLWELGSGTMDVAVARCPKILLWAERWQGIEDTRYEMIWVLQEYPLPITSAWLMHLTHLTSSLSWLSFGCDEHSVLESMGSLGEWGSHHRSGMQKRPWHNWIQRLPLVYPLQGVCVCALCVCVGVCLCLCMAQTVWSAFVQQMVLSFRSWVAVVSGGFSWWFGRHATSTNLRETSRVRMLQIWCSSPRLDSELISTAWRPTPDQAVGSGLMRQVRCMTHHPKERFMNRRVA